jgi:hypothetical protein
MRENGGEEQSSDQKIFSGVDTQATGTWRERGLKGSAYAVCPIRKNLAVMSQ